MGGTGKNLCSSVQPNHWRPCKACTAGAWCVVHQVAAWPDRRRDRRTDLGKRIHAVFFGRISEFRRLNLDALKDLCRCGKAYGYVQILQICLKVGIVNMGDVALDGTKVQANASKHKAMSHERVVRRIVPLFWLRSKR
jgi:hypothetical protein